MCCVHCSSDKPSDNTHNRVGRKINQFCSVCQVYICDNCWEQFHNSPVLDLPPCVTGKYHLAVQTRSNAPQCTPCPPDVSSPVRVSRPKRDVAGPSRVSNESSNQHMTSTLRGSPIRRLNRQRRDRGTLYIWEEPTCDVNAQRQSIKKIEQEERCWGWVRWECCGCCTTATE